MRKLIFLLTILSLVLILAACSAQGSTQEQTDATSTGSDLPTATQAVQSPVETPEIEAVPDPTNPPADSNGQEIEEPPVPLFAGQPVSFNGVELVIPDALDSDIPGFVVPGQEGNEFPYWDIFPQHTRLDFQSYPLQDTLLKPQILVFPAQEYASLQTVIADNLVKLNAILADPTQPLTYEMLPIHMVNAARLYVASVKVLDFQNGQGVRYLTQHAQYFAPANNQDLFYFFCGLTSDQNYYVIAILPVRTAMLPDQPEPGFPIDLTGLSDAQIETAVQEYYAGVKDLLEDGSVDLTPELETLDNMIGSLRISEQR
ncbi:MAG: hypothetical protein JW862_10740 [Anaerolineales bacterium]|nr:hypothetical protein [Anaerolineales bacterium]